MTKQNETVRNLKDLEVAVAKLRDMYANETDTSRHARYVAALKISMFVNSFMDELESAAAAQAEDTYDEDDVVQVTYHMGTPDYYGKEGVASVTYDK